MGRLAGSDRQAVLEGLLEDFDAVVAGGGPRVVSLEASLGLGKTRLIQELYARLAAGRQGLPRYWPPALDWQESSAGGPRRDVLQSRKQVEPAPGWIIPGGTDIPWLWWGIPCQLNYTGSPMRALQDASGQLRVHLDPLASKIARSGRNLEDAQELLMGISALTGVLSAGSAMDAGSAFLGVLRRRLADRRRHDLVAMDRQVDTHANAYAEAARLAESLTAVARAGTPVVLAVDDAHWADPALVSLLRHLAKLDGAPILMITTAWPDQLAAESARSAGSFAGWLTDAAAAAPGRVRRVELGPMGTDALGEIILEFADRTPAETVEKLAARASGSPLVLNLILDLDVVRRDVAADGSIDTDPAELVRVPSNLRALYQDLWRQLPVAVQRALALVAVQGPEFLVGFADDAATRLAMREEALPALAAAQQVHRWLRPVGDDLAEFVEAQRYEIVADVLPEIFDEDAQRTIREALVEHVLRLKSSPRWRELDVRTRRVALEGHLEADMALGDGAARDRGTLGDSMVQLSLLDVEAGEPGRAALMAQRALQLFEPGDVIAVAAAREALAQALVAAGRPDEAAPILAAIAAQRGEASSAVSEAAELVDELAAVSPPTEPRVARVDADALGREPLIAWAARAVPPLAGAPASEVASLVAEVVSAEGPVYAARVYDLLRSASGAGRLGRQIRASLDAGVRSAVRRGLIVASVPDVTGDGNRRVLRLPSQPEVRLRVPGDRGPEGIPYAELAELARAVLRAEPELNRTELKTRLSSLIGAESTPSVNRLLEAALPATLGVEPVRPAVDQWGRAPWSRWQPRELPALVGLKPSLVAPHIVELVEAEGPVTVGRTFELLRRASGAGRLSAGLRASLEAGVASAERQGALILARGRRGDPDSRTLRVPSQPAVVLRVPGDRDAASIPVGELAELARRVREVLPDATRDQVKRQVAHLLGFGRYTESIDGLLERSLPLE